MTTNRVRLACVGGGSRSFIGIVHRIAAYMGEHYELVGGVFETNHERGIAFAQSLGLDQNRTYANLEQFVEAELALPESERVEVVSILTPNYLHYSQALQLIEAGFNILCEKPITTTAEQASHLYQRVIDKGVVFGLAHTYTGYPMVRQMREMVASGELGTIQKIDVQYYQGWINPAIHDKEKRAEIWRLDPEKSGQSCCFGDIGIHAFNLAEYVSGLTITQVLADMNTLYDDNLLDVDGTALIRTSEGVRGIIRASQIATGEENNLALAIYGDKGAVKWSQERPTEMTFLTDDQPRKIYKPGNAYNSDFAQQSTKIAPGHPEGLFDAMANIYLGVAHEVRGKAQPRGSYPSVAEGVRGMQFVEAVLQSHKENQVWVNIHN